MYLCCLAVNWTVEILIGCQLKGKGDGTVLVLKNFTIQISKELYLVL